MDEKNLRKELDKQEYMQNLMDRINSADNRDIIITQLKDELLEIFEAERITVFAVDGKKRQLYSKVKEGKELKKIRVDMDTTSIAGFCSVSKQLVNIKNAYDNTELKEIHPNLSFDSKWDKKSGFETKQVLACPISYTDDQVKGVYGVIQVLNTKLKEYFDEEDEKNIQKICKSLGIAFRNFSKLTPTRYNYLITNNIIGWDDLDRIRRLSTEYGKDMEDVLKEDYSIPKEWLLASYSYHYRIPSMEFDSMKELPFEYCKKFNLNYLKNNLWVPVDYSEGVLTILLNDYEDLKVEDIKGLYQGDKTIKKFDFRIGLKEDIFDYLKMVENPEWSNSFVDDFVDNEDDEEVMEEENEEQIDQLSEKDSKIIKLVNQMIIQGYKKGASDIHIEPDKNSKQVNIRYRIDGICMEEKKISYSHLAPVVSRVKIMSGLKIEEKRKPQDGKIKVKIGKKPVELRVATVPTVDGESAVLRILGSNETLPLEKLGLSQRNEENLNEILNMPHGIILVVGPTGSGKTTTLHSALNTLNSPEKKIWTAEDPVEINQKGLNQVEVNSNIGFHFADAMRSFLRADPDVIMVGEMRDQETAKMGVEASLTGHLVFSTLHTNSAPETVVRLVELGIDPFNLTDALLGVLAQRLVRTLCKDCKEPYTPSREEFDELVHSYGEEYFHTLGIEYNKDLKLYKAVGCDKCNNTGYKGRIGIHELLIGTENVKKKIQKNAPGNEIREQAMQDGMRLLFQDGIEKIFKGLTDKKQVNLVCQNDLSK